MAGPVKALTLLIVPLLWEQDPQDAARIRVLHDPDQRRSAQAYLVRRGAAVVPVLRAALEGALREKPVAAVRAQALLEVLATFGPGAVPALPEVIDAYYVNGNKDLRRASLDCLIALSPFDRDGTTPLFERMRELGNLGDIISVHRFFEMVSATQVDGDASAADLVELLQDDNPYTRATAARIIAHRASTLRDDPKARKVLVTALAVAVDSDHPRNFNLSWKFGGTSCSSSGSAQHDDTIQSLASFALTRLEPDHPAAARGYAWAATHLDQMVAAQSLRMLPTMPIGEVEPHMERVLDALTKGTPLVAREAATTLGILGLKTPAILEALGTAARSADRQLAARAAASLEALGAGR